MAKDSSISPISDLLRHTVIQAVEHGRATFKGLERDTGVSRLSIMRFAKRRQFLRLDLADRLADFSALSCNQSERVGETWGPCSRSK